MAIPSILIYETCSFRNATEPMVVRMKTQVAKIGYDFDRSLKDRTRNQIKNDNPYRASPNNIYGL